MLIKLMGQTAFSVDVVPIPFRWQVILGEVAVASIREECERERTKSTSQNTGRHRHRHKEKHHSTHVCGRGLVTSFIFVWPGRTTYSLKRSAALAAEMVAAMIGKRYFMVVVVVVPFNFFMGMIDARLDASSLFFVNLFRLSVCCGSVTKSCAQASWG